MKKIIVAIDGLKFSASATEYAVQIAKEMNAHLVGVFLDDATYTSYKIYDIVVKEGASQSKLNQYEQQDAEKRKESAGRFESVCSNAGIHYSIHHDHNIALRELLHESIYADLLIIDSHETLTHYEEKQPTRFIRDLLADVQCPVLLVPHKYKPVESIELLYDGKPSSVYAIKMFSYLLSAYNNLNIELISVKNIEQNLHLTDSRLLKEFLKRHFPEITYRVIKGFAEDEITKYVKSVGPNVLVVLGAYQRGKVSRWFHESMADTLLKEIKSPIFIAHQ